jgi:pSer/pThr/pTyr-binding forkhead associated (FHA) protein
VSRFGKLVCLNGPLTGREYDLDADIITVGRGAETLIRLDDQFASRQHAEIRHFDNTYQVHDLQSKNGVFVDGRRLPGGGSAWLADGMELQFASTRFRFYDPSATVTAPSLIAVREPGLRVDITTRQVFVDGETLNPPIKTEAASSVRTRSLRPSGPKHRATFTMPISTAW